MPRYEIKDVETGNIVATIQAGDVGSVTVDPDGSASWAEDESYVCALSSRNQL